MADTITIEHEYMTGTCVSEIDLPEGYTAADVSRVSVRHCTATIFLGDGSHITRSLGYPEPSIDTDRPAKLRWGDGVNMTEFGGAADRAAVIEKFRPVLQDCLDVIDDLARGVGIMALRDYAKFNGAPIAARRLLRETESKLPDHTAPSHLYLHTDGRITAECESDDDVAYNLAADTDILLQELASFIVRGTPNHGQEVPLWVYGALIHLTQQLGGPLPYQPNESLS